MDLPPSLTLIDKAKQTCYTHIKATEGISNMSNTPKKKILVVDDEKNILRLLQVTLQQKGYTVITASNGHEALYKLKTQVPDLVILDVMMPHVDGFEVLRAMKEDACMSIIPVIMLTAKAQDEDVFKGWQSGVDCYLTKPFNPTELLTFVKRIFTAVDKHVEDDAKVYDLS